MAAPTADIDIQGHTYHVRKVGEITVNGGPSWFVWHADTEELIFAGPSDADSFPAIRHYTTIRKALSAGCKWGGWG